MNIDALVSFFGWCSVINIAILLFSTVAVLVMREAVTKIHGRLFNLSEEKLAVAYFTYLAQFKIAVLVFNVGPYLALKMMS